MLINGQIADTLPANDRGLAYGDGLFETIRISQGRAVLLAEHLQRLLAGCQVLGIPADTGQLQQQISLALAHAESPDCIVKLILTRGSGGRGYVPPQQPSPNCIISLHELPDYSSHRPEAGISALVCRQRLAEQPVLAGLKHLNRLEQVLASRELVGSQYLEGIMMDYQDRVIEGTRSNLFVSYKGRLLTPSLQRCGVAGVMRRILLEHYAGKAEETDLGLETLREADEVFVVNSVFGVWPLTELQSAGETIRYSCGPCAEQALQVFAKVLRQ